MLRAILLPRTKLCYPGITLSMPCRYLTCVITQGECLGDCCGATSGFIRLRDIIAKATSGPCGPI